jgi:cellulose synthase operon protein YhjQ
MRTDVEEQAVSAERAPAKMDDAGDMSDPKHPGASSKTSAADDVATLYSWANLHGAKYRDFTASRQELRMQARRRADQAAEPPAAKNRDAMQAHIPAPIIDENIRVSGWQQEPPPQEIPDHAGAGNLPDMETPAVESAGPRRAGFEETVADARQEDGGPIMPAWLEHILPGKRGRQAEAAQELPAAPQAPDPAPSPVEEAAPFRLVPEPRGLGERHEYSLETQEITYPLAPAQPVPYAAPPVAPPRMPSEARWSALQDLFEPARRHEVVVSSVQRLEAPVLALFSVAGGVGKTSLAANLGRALASFGERPLLAETSIHGVLPFYFGARSPRPGVVRTFASNSAQQAPIQLLSLDGDRHIAEGDTSSWLYEDLRQGSREASRIVIDVSGGLLGSIRQVLRLSPVVVVPVLPDVSSVAALQTVDDLFRGQMDAAGQPIEPRFLLNQFDASLSLHRDVRDMLLQKYGERLLPFVIHRSTAVSEALAEGLTVLDYAPASEVASDILHFAGWVRSLANAGASVSRGVRWSER